MQQNNLVKKYRIPDKKNIKYNVQFNEHILLKKIANYKIWNE